MLGVLGPKLWTLLQWSGTGATPALYIANDLSQWTSPESTMFDGLVVKRPFVGKWDALQCDIDAACSRWGQGLGITASSESRQFSAKVHTLLDTAGLPHELSLQLHEDACALGHVWKELCPDVQQFKVKLEIFGENTCQRWHRDHFVGRSIVSYTGAVGTEYTAASNVNFWELEHGGNNDCILHDPENTESVAVGDLLLIKGTKFPQVSNPLVHKSPEKRYDHRGNIQNRLILKVDVDELPSAERLAG